MIFILIKDLIVERRLFNYISNSLPLVVKGLKSFIFGRAFEYSDNVRRMNL